MLSIVRFESSILFSENDTSNIIYCMNRIASHMGVNLFSTNIDNRTLYRVWCFTSYLNGCTEKLCSLALHSSSYENHIIMCDFNVEKH